MLVCVFFFFKQKTAYEMRISDWSSDVCSSDLLVDTPFSGAASDASWLAKRATAGLSVSDSEPDTRKVIREISNAAANEWLSKTDGADIPLWAQPSATMLVEIGRASCRERVCQYV